MVWVTRVEFSQSLVGRFDLHGRMDNNKIAQRYAIFLCSLVVEIYTGDSLVGQRQAKRLQRLKIIIVHFRASMIMILAQSFQIGRLLGLS